MNQESLKGVTTIPEVGNEFVRISSAYIIYIYYQIESFKPLSFCQLILHVFISRTWKTTHPPQSYISDGFKEVLKMDFIYL